MVFTDHDAVADVSEAAHLSVLSIPGAEVGVCWDGAFGAELLCLGITEIRRKGATPQQVIDDTLAQGGLPYVSHPYLSGVHSALMNDLEGLIGIEVYNAAAGGLCNRAMATVHLNELIAMGKPVWALASGDRHSTRRPLQAWVEVRAGRLDQESILEAMRNGYYYSTTGPRIHDISVNETHVSVKCSEAQQITFSSLPWLSKTVIAGKNEPITEASVPLDVIGSTQKIEETVQWLMDNRRLTVRKDLKPVVRIEIADAAGKFAWSNPIPIP